MTKAHGNLSDAGTFQQKARNTCLSDVVDLVGGSGDTQRIPCPENWPFACPSSPRGEIESMVTQTRARATKRMTDKSLTKSACKKPYIVRTKLVNNDEEYISIVKDILPAVCSINSLVKY